MGDWKDTNFLLCFGEARQSRGRQEGRAVLGTVPGTDPDPGAVAGGAAGAGDSHTHKSMACSRISGGLLGKGFFPQHGDI